MDHDTEMAEQLRSLLEGERDAISDAGFSSQVMARLPGRGIPWFGRAALIPGMTMIGGIVGLFILPGGEFLSGLMSRVPHLDLAGAFPVPWLVLVYLLCWTAIASERREQVQP